MCEHSQRGGLCVVKVPWNNKIFVEGNESEPNAKTSVGGLVF